jgi:hypothetical protein
VVTVKLASRPAGAAVHGTDGALLGQTPLAVSLRTGSVQKLTFSKRGYQAITRKVSVGGGSQSVVVDLPRPAARRPPRGRR